MEGRLDPVGNQQPSKKSSNPGKKRHICTVKNIYFVRGKGVLEGEEGMGGGGDEERGAGGGRVGRNVRTGTVKNNVALTLQG